MWRITNRVSTALQQRSPGVFSTPSNVAASYGSPHSSVRHESKAAASEAKQPPAMSEPIEAPPPPPPPPRGGGWFWKFFGLTTVGTGSVIGYAWYDANFRKTIEGTVPYSKDTFEFLFHYLPGSEGAPKKSKPPETSSPSLLKKKEITGAESKDVLHSRATGPVSSTPAATKEDTSKKGVVDTDIKKRQEKERAEMKLRDQEQKEIVENRELEFLLDKLTNDASQAVEKAVALSMAAAEAIRAHTNKVKQAMESSSSEGEWEVATEVHQARSDAVWSSEAARDRAKASLEKLRTIVDDGKHRDATKKNKALLATEAEFNKLNNMLSSAAGELSKVQSEAKVFGEYRELVQKGKEQFKKELESILPDVKLGEKKGSLTEEELNSLIAHAHRRIEQLQRQLVGYQVLEQQRIAAALDKQRQEDEKLAEEFVEREKAKIQAELLLQKQTWDAEACVEFEKELRTQLSRQAAAHSDHIVAVLRVQEKELKERFELDIITRIDAERAAFQKQVGEYIDRLNGIETALEARADLEKQGRRAKELWLACQSLQAAITAGGGIPNYQAIDYESQLKPLKNQIIAIREAGDGNPYVASVLAAIPESATYRGVWTEAALIERFSRVSTIGRRVAMIDDTTPQPTLLRYFISYLQSLFVLSAGAFVPTRDSLITPDELDTFALLNNAERCMERGDLEQAVKFVNALRGEPRRVARDWLFEARLLLETRQAAEALVAFAAASGLSSLF